MTPQMLADLTGVSPLETSAREGLEALQQLRAELEGLEPPRQHQRFAEPRGDPGVFAAIAAAMNRYPDEVKAELIRLRGIRGFAALTKELEKDLRQRAAEMLALDHQSNHPHDEQPELLSECLGDLTPGTATALKVPEGWLVQPDGVFKLNQGGSPKVPPVQKVTDTPVFICERSRDIEDGTTLLQITWHRPGGWQHAEISRDHVMNHRKLLELSKWDFPVHSGNAPNLTRYLAAFENVNLDSLPTARSTSRMGPHEGNVFLWGQATLSKAGPSTPLRLKAEGGAAQIAAGFRSHGHLADWLSMVEDIQDFPAALLAVYAALTPPLLYFLPDAPNFAVDWSGRTSIGKTTVLRLAGSCWGIPDERQAGPVGSWDATYCGVEERARLVTGMPLILDDTKNVRNSHSIAQTIYHVIGGQGRSRSSRDVSLRHQRYWKTVLLSSGEAPLTSFTQDGGTRARVIPVYNAPFGADPERGRDVVERLRHKMAHSYGHAGPALVRWLLQHADQHDRGLHCWHAAAKERWAARATDGVTGRMSHYLAVLDVCRQVAKHSLDLHIDSDDMLEFTWEAVQEATSDSDRGAAALRLVASWMVSQQSSFYDRSTPNPERPPPAGWLGSWERGDWTDAGFLPDRLQTYLENHDFSFIEITSDWQRRGWLKVNKGRNQRPKRDIAGKRVRCIVVKRSAFAEVGEFEEWN